MYAVDASNVDDAELSPGKLARLLVLDLDEGCTSGLDSNVVPTSKSDVLVVVDPTTTGLWGLVPLLDSLPLATIPPVITAETIRAAKKTAMRRLPSEEHHLLPTRRERWSTASLTFLEIRT